MRRPGDVRFASVAPVPPAVPSSAALLTVPGPDNGPVFVELPDGPRALPDVEGDAIPRNV
jgi:hypothetical protein